MKKHTGIARENERKGYTMNKYEKNNLMMVIGKQSIPPHGIPELRTIVRSNLEAVMKKEVYGDPVKELLENVAIDAFLYGHMKGIQDERTRKRIRSRKTA